MPTNISLANVRARVFFPMKKMAKRKNGECGHSDINIHIRIQWKGTNNWTDSQNPKDIKNIWSHDIPHRNIGFFSKRGNNGSDKLWKRCSNRDDC